MYCGLIAQVIEVNDERAGTLLAWVVL